MSKQATCGSSGARSRSSAIGDKLCGWCSGARGTRPSSALNVSQPPCGQGEHQSLQVHAYAQGVGRPRSRCMQTMPAIGAPKKSKLHITAAACLAVSAMVIPIEP